MYFANFHSDPGSFQGAFWRRTSFIGAQIRGGRCGCTLWSVVFSACAYGWAVFPEVQGLSSDVLNLLLLLPGPLASSAEPLDCGL